MKLKPWSGCLKNKVRIPFSILIFTLVLTACLFRRDSGPTKGISGSTPRSIDTLKVTPTELQLPFNDQNEDWQEYCQWPYIQLATAEAQGMDEEAIAGELMDIALAHFKNPQAPGFCRIDDYRIDRVFYDEKTPLYPLEPKGDFIRTVLFWVKLVQAPNMWASFSGEIDTLNWLHTGVYVAVFRSSGGYTMQFANP